MVATEIEVVTFSDVMGLHCAGVAVATCPKSGHGPDAGKDPGSVEPTGLTLTSLISYTAEPPSVLISVDVNSRSHDAMLRSPAIGIHLLAEDQDQVAHAFSSKAERKFDRLEWRWDDGVPRLSGVLAYMRCRPERSFAHRDHTVLIAQVETAEIERRVQPLVYHDRKTDWRLRKEAEG